MGFENGVDPFPKREVRISHDPRANPRRPVAATRAHGCNSIDKFRFPDRREVGVSIRTIHRVALHEINVTGYEGPLLSLANVTGTGLTPSSKLEAPQAADSIPAPAVPYQLR